MSFEAITNFSSVYNFNFTYQSAKKESEELQIKQNKLALAAYPTVSERYPWLNDVIKNYGTIRDRKELQKFATKGIMNLHFTDNPEVCDSLACQEYVEHLVILRQDLALKLYELNKWSATGHLTRILGHEIGHFVYDAQFYYKQFLAAYPL